MKLIESTSNYLLEFVSSLLQSLQSESKGTDPVIYCDYFNTAEFLEEVRRMMEPIAKQNKTKIIIEGNPNEMILTDKNKLRQVFVNFVSNSIKFTKEGIITLCFERLSRSLMRFGVKDSGVGMSEESRMKMFVPFNTSGHNGIKNCQGIGLGTLHFSNSEIFPLGLAVLKKC